MNDYRAALLAAIERMPIESVESMIYTHNASLAPEDRANPDVACAIVSVCDRAIANLGRSLGSELPDEMAQRERTRSCLAGYVATGESWSKHLRQPDDDRDPADLDPVNTTPDTSYLDVRHPNGSHR